MRVLRGTGFAFLLDVKKYSLFVVLGFLAVALSSFSQEAKKDHDTDRVIIGKDGKAKVVPKPQARPAAAPSKFPWVEKLFCMKQSESMIVRVDQISNNFHEGVKKDGLPIFRLRVKLRQLPPGKDKMTEHVLWESNPIQVAKDSSFPRSLELALESEEGLFGSDEIEKFLLTNNPDKADLELELVELESKTRQETIPADPKVPGSKPQKKTVKFLEQVGEPLHTQTFDACKTPGEAVVKAQGGSVNAWLRYKKADFSNIKDARKELTFEGLRKLHPNPTVTGFEDGDFLIVKTRFTNEKEVTAISNNRDYSLLISLKDSRGNLTPIMEPYKYQVDFQKSKAMQFEIPIEHIHKKAEEHTKAKGLVPSLIYVHGKDWFGNAHHANVEIPLDSEQGQKVAELFSAMIDVEKNLPAVETKELKEVMRAVRGMIMWAVRDKGIPFLDAKKLLDLEIQLLAKDTGPLLNLTKQQENDLRKAFIEFRSAIAPKGKSNPNQVHDLHVELGYKLAPRYKQPELIKLD